jgi:lysozyme family protein
MAVFSDRIQNHIKASEGGYVNDPKDPGGETNFGISKRSYPGLDIKALTWAKACEIYRKDFWEKYRFPALTDQGLAENVLDHAINAGPGRAIKLLQKACGVAEDGKIGPATIAAANRDIGTAGRFASLRITYYHSLVAAKPELGRFLKGWIARANKFRNHEAIA